MCGAVTPLSSPSLAADHLEKRLKRTRQTTQIFFAVLFLAVTLGWPVPSSAVAGRSFAEGDEMESERGRKDGIFLPFHTRMDQDATATVGRDG